MPRPSTEHVGTPWYARLVTGPRRSTLSKALKQWQSTGLSHLNELEKIHTKATGRKPGRRWETTQLNRSLFVALVAQFQTYCRNLHDEAVEVHKTHAHPPQADLVGSLMTQGRKLDKETPRRSALGSDFAKLGFDVVGGVKSVGRAETEMLQSLDLLVDFRNAIGHGNETEIAALIAGGRIKDTKRSYLSYRRRLEELAVIMDDVVAAKLASVLRIAAPW